MKTNLMVFIAGDNDLDTFGTTDIEEMMSVKETGSNLTILVQQDQSVMARDSGAKRFVIRNGEKIETIHLGETNTGDENTLREFVIWGLKEHKADRNIVVLWNHGGGTRDEEYRAYDNNQTTIENIARVRLAPSRAVGKSTLRAINLNPTIGNQASFFPQKLRLKRIEELMKSYQLERGEAPKALLEVESKSILFDDESRDFLDNLELKRVFDGLDKIDIIGFDACLMGMMEVAYQLKDHAEVVVGSEELEPGKGWDYMAIVSYLVSNPTASNEEVSKEIIRSFMDSYKTQSSLKVTLSSIRTSKLENVARLMNLFAHTILRKELNVRGALLSVVDATQTFDYQNNEQIYRDLKHFIILTKEHYIDDAEIVQSADKLLSALEEVIIENQSKNFNHAHGLSVYLPIVNNMSGFAVAVFSALEINKEGAAPYWLKLFKQIGNIDNEENTVYGTDPLDTLIIEEDWINEDLIVEEDVYEGIDPNIAFTDLLPIPSIMNEGVESARNSLMQALLGNPRSTYSENCSREGPTGKLGQRIVWGKNVGPFNVSGFDLAVDSLREVFAEATTVYPELVESLSSAGMLCCRYVRGSHTAISNHSWGTAIDLKINGKLDKPYNKKVQYGLALLAPIFNKHGWFWGAAFHNEDAMHFEISKEKMLEWEAEGKLLNIGNSEPEEKPTYSSSLSLGDRGQAVLELQHKLNRLGYELIEDGIFGNDSYYVVLDFQREHGLVVDGIVGSKTMELIDGLLTTRTVRTVKAKTPDLKFGTRSRWVQVAQEYLNRYGFELMENGVFDKLMLQAVYDFQKSLGVEPTGIVDANLWFTLQNPTRTKLEITRHIPTLVLGDSNSEVVQIQSILEKRGFELPQDSYFGLETQIAVKKFQEENSLDVTGEVDEETYRKIME